MMAEPLDRDLPLLVEAFGRAAAPVRVAAWDDPTVDWGSFDLVILRSTWDYVERPDEFLRWLSDVAVRTTAWNSPDVVAWNMDKHYLGDLAAAGVPVVPTVFARRGDAIPPLDGDRDLVVKPTIGAGSRGAVRRAGDAAAAHVRALHAEGCDAMIQPYQALIDELGETVLVYLGDGRRLRFSHAVSKRAILSGEVQREGGFLAVEHTAPHVATPDELAIGEAVLATPALRGFGPLAYARIDLVPAAEGPVVLELELIEPSLHLPGEPGSADRAAAGWRRLADS